MFKQVLIEKDYKYWHPCFDEDDIGYSNIEILYIDKKFVIFTNNGHFITICEWEHTMENTINIINSYYDDDGGFSNEIMAIVKNIKNYKIDYTKFFRTKNKITTSKRCTYNNKVLLFLYNEFIQIKNIIKYHSENNNGYIVLVTDDLINQLEPIGNY